MRRSTDRVLTTHVGALERPPELARTLAEQGQWAPAALGQLSAGVADVVKRQLEVGLDVINDGEFGKTMWSQYIRDRLDGLEARPRAIATDQVARGRDRERFPGFYAWADASKAHSPILDKDAMSETFLKYKGAEAGDIDWRPTETVPEDFYAM